MQECNDNKKKRHILYYDDDTDKQVTAAGVLIYKIENGKMALLLVEKEGKYEDIGGKVERGDDTIISVVMREVEEETNGVITGEDIRTRLIKAPYVYVGLSKYVVYIIEANEEERALEKEKFGSREKFTDKSRTIKWINLETIKDLIYQKYKINWRLKSGSLMDKLTNIEKGVKFNKSLFAKKLHS